ncbi:MAG: sigma-54-dependent transcriptional regulator [Aureispira sp.]
MKTTTEGIKIFIVEDDLVFAKTIRYILTLNPDHDVRVFKTGKECLNNLHLNPHIVSLDYSLPDMTGGEVLRRIKIHNADIGVIILSGQKDVATAVELLQKGADDYLTKDEANKERLFNIVEKLKKNISLQQEVETLKEELTEKYQFGESIKGNSPAMQKIFKLLEKAASSNINVSVTGETGTGKELVAKSIHYNSPRKKGKFVAINVSAIPNDLLESELFGYEKGAFTGANTRKQGKFEVANNGTLFLDEIGEMEFHLQAKLLRALQEREITRIGGNETVKFDARIIVATHRNLSDLVSKGNFREDLYYRLLGLSVHLPPLRRRGNDVLILAKHFLNTTAKENNLGTMKLGQTAKDKLLSYTFPGNIRELKAIIELAAIMCNGKTIQREDLQFNSPRKNADFFLEEMTLREYNIKIVRHYLKQNDNNIPKVAKILGIGKTTIYRMLKEDEEFTKK